jgi:uncharacterized membrane protein
MKSRFWICTVSLLVWMSAAAFADTGGSMGGGSFSGGGGGGYSSSGGGGYSSSSSSSSSYSSDSSSSGSGGGGGIAIAVGGIVGLISLFAGGANSQQNSGPQIGQLRDLMRSDNSSHNNAIADITELRIALDGEVRPYVQSEIMRIAKTCDTSTAAGRLRMFQEVTLMLRRLRASWVYGGATNYAQQLMSDAQQTFHKHAADARSKFKHEVIRNVDGHIDQQSVATPPPRHEEGPGLVLVVIVAAARSDFFTVSKIGDGEQLRQALDAACNRSADDLVAVEIIWQPAVTDDRLSSVELEAKYPAPALIKLPGSTVGRSICKYCSGPYPLELLTCPHCGARSA